MAIPCHWSERSSVISEVMQVYAGPKGRTLIFCDTKKEANDLQLGSEIKADCQVLHGDISQAQRESTLQAYRDVSSVCC